MRRDRHVQRHVCCTIQPQRTGFTKKRRFVLHIGRDYWIILFENYTSLILGGLVIAVIIGPTTKRRSSKRKALG